MSMNCCAAWTRPRSPIRWSTGDGGFRLNDDVELVRLEAGDIHLAVGHEVSINLKRRGVVTRQRLVSCWSAHTSSPAAKRHLPPPHVRRHASTTNDLASTPSAQQYSNCPIGGLDARATHPGSYGGGTSSPSAGGMEGVGAGDEGRHAGIVERAVGRPLDEVA